jgi:hypothetical protein
MNMVGSSKLKLTFCFMEITHDLNMAVVRNFEVMSGQTLNHFVISGSHSGEYEDDSLLGHSSK